jgi:hypothetical protein
MTASTRAKESDEQKPRQSRLTHRLANIETLLLYRREHDLPEADEYEMLTLAFNAIVHDPLSQRADRVGRMIAWGTKFFPTIDVSLLEQLAIGCGHSLCFFTNERAADMAELDVDTRLHLGIRMIGAMGHTASDLKKQAAGRKRTNNRERNTSLQRRFIKCVRRSS